MMEGRADAGVVLIVKLIREDGKLDTVRAMLLIPPGRQRLGALTAGICIQFTRTHNCISKWPCPRESLILCPVTRKMPFRHTTSARKPYPNTCSTQ